MHYDSNKYNSDSMDYNLKLNYQGNYVKGSSNTIFLDWSLMIPYRGRLI